MNNLSTTVDSAITEVDSLKKNLKKKKSKQIYSADELALLKATSLAWFKNHKVILSNLDNHALTAIDNQFHIILEGGDKKPARAHILKTIDALKKDLISLRKRAIQSTTTNNSPPDSPPDFSSLISDDGMKLVLCNRWSECIICVQHNAPLAAIVMIGGLLEGLLLAKVNKEPDQSKIYKTKSVPKDRKTAKPKQLGEWTLTDFINVAHELNWVSKPAKDIGSVLREYRNYIHPHKEYTNKLTLSKSDAMLFWDIAKNITYQLLI